MKILVYGQIYPDSFARNISITLKDMGHEVLLSSAAGMKIGTNRFWLLKYRFFYYAGRLISSLEQRTEQKLVDEAREIQPDLIILPGEQAHPSTIRQLKNVVKSKVVQWMSDQLNSFGRQYILASDYDAFFFKDEYIVQFVREKLGKRAYFLPQACNPMWHRRPILTEQDKMRYGCDITVAGNLYWYRALMLEPFMDYDLKIWGNYVPRWLESTVTKHYQYHYVAEEEKAKAFNAAKIVLNTMHYAEILGCNLRLFEAAGCGAFQIVDWRPNLYKVLEPEREVVTFRTREELKQKVDYYLAHDNERQLIADRAYARAHAEHTYKHRLTQLIEWTFNGNPNVD